MGTSKLASLKPLIESKDGLHLTAYLRGRGTRDMRRQLKDVMATGRELLKPALPPDEVERFLEPIRLLSRDKNFLKRLSGNFGLFRTGQFFRILNVPIEVDELCVVASSFHVKPLLRWVQVSREFLLLGFEPGRVSLYQGTLSSIRYYDSIPFAGSPGDWDWLNQWINRATAGAEPRLFVAGERNLVNDTADKLRYRNLFHRPFVMNFSKEALASLWEQIREILKGDSRRTLEQALIEFHIAEDMKLAKKNIFQVAKAVVQGRVKKLIVADGIQIFGKIDPRTGGLAIHPGEMDHEDDDILDDLAQAVIRQGGEVIVAGRSEIPKGHPVMAILERSADELNYRSPA